MANLFRQDRMPEKLWMTKPGPILFSARDVDAGDRHAEHIDEEIERDQDLANNGNLYAYKPRRRTGKRCTVKVPNSRKGVIHWRKKVLSSGRTP